MLVLLGNFTATLKFWMHGLSRSAKIIPKHRRGYRVLHLSIAFCFLLGSQKPLIDIMQPPERTTTSTPSIFRLSLYNKFLLQKTCFNLYVYHKPDINLLILYCSSTPTAMAPKVEASEAWMIWGHVLHISVFLRPTYGFIPLIIIQYKPTTHPTNQPTN